MNELKGIPRQVAIVPDSNIESGEVEIIRGSYQAPDKTYELVFVRARFASTAAYWLIRKVSVAGVEIWGYKTSRFTGRAQLFLVQKEPIIAEINRQEIIKEVIFLSDIGKTTVLTAPDGKQVVFGGKSLAQKILAKRGIARQNSDFKPGLSEEEAAFEAKDRQIKAEAVARVKAKDAERRRLRKEQILARPSLTVYSDKGEQLFGQPVTADEWRVLEIGVYGILVESYNDDTKIVGEPLEAFRVIRAKGGQKEKAVKSTAIFLKTPLQIQAVLDFLVGGELRPQVPVIAKEDLVTFARNFNAGSMVAMALPEADQYQIYELVSGEPRAIGESTPV